MASSAVRRYAEWRGVDEADVADLAGPGRPRPPVAKCPVAGCIRAPRHAGPCTVVKAPF